MRDITTIKNVAESLRNYLKENYPDDTSALNSADQIVQLAEKLDARTGTIDPSRKDK